VKHFKDGNAHRRPAALWSTENCCNWAQQAKSRRAHQTRPKDNIQRNCNAAWSGALCGPEDDGNFGISEICSRWVPPLLTGTEEHKTAGNCYPIHPTVRI
jgi:hypothetical protein